MENGICLVSGDHDAIDWLTYQLMSLGEVTLADWKSVRGMKLKQFDWVIFDISGSGQTENTVNMKIGGLSWIAGRCIARVDLTNGTVRDIPGLKLVDSHALSVEFGEIIAGVRA